tara:strand:+ start:5473 stop:6249 length:777 start_codon:yes stop_codon:yes gene_type:complete
MPLGLGSNLSKTGIITPGIVTDNLVLKHKYDAGSVIPCSDGAAFFDGVNDYIECRTTNLNPNSITVAAWVRLPGEAPTDSYPRIVVGDGDEKSWHLRYDKSGGQFVGRFSVNGSDVELCQTDSTYTDYSKWYHVAVNYNSSNGECKIYVDGVHDGTDSGGITGNLHVPSTLGVRIGQETNSTNNNWDGYICNVGIWSSVLTQPQIKSIMNKNYAGLTSSEKTNLISWWNLDVETNTFGESGTGGVKDYHGSNHGTLSQ